MCFGGGKPKVPDVQPVPTPAPAPTVLPTSVSEVSAQESARKKRIANLRYGFASTIKTKPIGTNMNPDNGGKKTLG